MSLYVNNGKAKNNKIAVQSKANHPRTGYTHTLFCLCDVDLDPITSIYELDLNILQLHLQT